MYFLLTKAAFHSEKNNYYYSVKQPISVLIYLIMFFITFYFL